jgi:hypothetical protein
MTDEQLKAIGLAVDAIGDAVVDIGNGLQQVAIAMLAAPPIDPPPPPPIDPPPPVDPPPPEESEFMRAVVLDQGFGGSRFEIPVVVQSQPVNPFGKSFGLSFSFIYNAPPNMASPLSLRNDENPFFQLFARGPTALGVVFGLGTGKWFDFDEVVDDMVGRAVHAVIGFDREEGLVEFWIDSVSRGTAYLPEGMGLFPDKTPPLIINSTVAGHQSGDLTPIRLLFAVGAAPSQEDVEDLYGVPKHEDGFFQGLEGGKVYAAAYGPQSELPLHDPTSFIDGRHVVMKQVVNNPPREKRWEAAVPDDIGREVQQ